MSRILRGAAVAILTCSALLATNIASAEGVTVGPMTIEHPWARPNLPNRPVAVYLNVTNSGTVPDRLVSATAQGFEAAEIHTVVMEGEVMKMQRIDGLDVPAGGGAMLSPGGNHLMLFGANQLYTEGAHFPLTLAFERAGEVSVEVSVLKRPPEGMGDGAGGMHHGQMHQMDHGTGAQSN